MKKLYILALLTVSMIYSMENHVQAPQLMEMKRVESLVKNKIKKKIKNKKIAVSNKTHFALVLEWDDQKIFVKPSKSDQISISIQKPTLVKIKPIAHQIHFQEYEYAHETECTINRGVKSITVTSKGTPCDQNCLKAMLSCNCCDEYSTLQIDTSS